MKHLSQAALLGATALAYPRAISRFRPMADANDPAAILAQLAKDFADFKAANDQALAGKADVVQTEKIGRIDASVAELQKAIDEISLKLSAQALNGGGLTGSGRPDTPDTRAYGQAFNTFFRTGEGTEAALKAMAVKAAMTTQSDPDGGYLVPFEMEDAIDRVLMNVSAMRQLAGKITISGGTYKKQVSLGGAGSGWVGETEARPATGTPQLVELEFTPGEIYANPFASQQLLDDARVDLAAWLADEVSITFSEQEGAAFVTGNGLKKPRGFLDYTIVADASYVWGKLGYVASGGAADFASSSPADALITLTQTPKVGYRSNANWILNRKTVSSVRKFKDGQGNYLWQPSIQVGQASSLLGYPVAEDDNMPDVAANAYPVAFGDFRRGYLIVDRMGVRVLRDPYTNKPFVGFYTTKRVGGGVQNFEAIKVLKIATS